MQNCLCFMALTAIFTSEVSASDLSSGLMLYTPFSGTIGDASGNGLIISNSMFSEVYTSDSRGLPNNALRFQQYGDSLSVPSENIQIGSNDFSFSAWINFDQIKIHTMNIIGLKVTSASIDYSVMFQISDMQELQFSFMCEDAAEMNAGTTTSSALSPDTWYHVALTVNRGQQNTMYVNGVEVYNNLISGTACDISSSAPYIIGAGNDMSDSQFIGAIDEVRFYNRALTPSEISELYSTGVSFTPSAAPTAPTHTPTVSPLDQGLVLYLPFTGTYTDTSGKGHMVDVMGTSLSSDYLGRANQALLLQIAGDLLTVDSSIDLNPESGDFSLCVWIKLEVTTGNRYIIGKGSFGGQSTFQLMVAAGKLFFQYECASGTAPNSGTAPTVLSVNTWYFVVFTVQRGVANTLYVNGAFNYQTMAGITVCALTNTAELRIGAMNAGGTQQFVGSLDEIRMYKRAVTAGEVAQLYARSMSWYPSMTPTMTPSVKPTIIPTMTPTDMLTLAPTVPPVASIAPTSHLFRDLLLYLPFSASLDDASGNLHTVDSSGVGLTLTTDRLEIDNHALLLTAAGDAVSITDAEALNFGTSDFSVSAWVKPAEIGDYMRIMGKGSTQFDASFVFRINPTGPLLFTYHCGGEGMNAQAGVTTFSLESDMWYHVAFTAQRGQFNTLYINGAQDFQGPAIGVICNVSNSVPFRVGAFDTVGTQQFIGSIDEVRVYKRALTAGEIGDLYSSSVSFHPSIAPSTAPTVVPTATPTSYLTRDLALYLPFTGTFVDASDSNHDIDVHGSGTAFTSDNRGIANQALSLSQSGDSLSIADFDVGISDFTLSAWIKANLTTTEARIFGKGAWNDPVAALMLRLEISMKLFFWYLCKDNTNTVVGNSGTSNAALTPNAWYHVTFTAERGQLNTIYINGVIDFQQTTVGDVCDVSNTVPFRVGAFDTVGTQQFIGSIDEVRVYKRALTAGEVGDLYSSTVSFHPSIAPSTAPTVAPSVVPTIATPTTPLFRDLALYLPFTGSVADTSGHNHAIDILGGSATLVIDRLGAANQALALAQGDDSLEIFEAESLNIGISDFSICAWVKFESVTRSKMIMRKATTNSPSMFFFRITPSTPKLQFRYFCDIVDLSENLGVTESNLETSAWHFVVFTAERGQFNTIYINGTQDYQSPTVGPVCNVSNSEAMVVGPFISGGIIDEVRLYKRALSASEVMELYATTVSYYPSLAPTETPTMHISENLVLYLPFTSSLDDASGNGHTVTAFGDTPLTANNFGELGQVMVLSTAGSGLMLYAAEAFNVELSDFSISAWIKLSEIGSVGRILGKGSASSVAAYYLQVDSDGSVIFRYHCSGSESINAGITNTALGVDTWYYVVFTAERGIQNTIYVNGVPDVQTATVGTVCSLSNTLSVNIGAVDVGGTEQFYGAMDNIRVHKRALSASEVASLYATGVSNHPTTAPTVAPSIAPTSMTPTAMPVIDLNDGLLVWYDFSEPTLIDKSAEGFDASFVGDVARVSDRNNVTGRAYQFSTGKHALLESFSPLDIGAGDFSIAVWIYLDTYGGTEQMLYYHGGHPACDAGYNCHITEGEPRVKCVFSCGDCAFVSMIASDALNLQTWYHVVFSVFRTDNANLYINGALRGQEYADDCDITNAVKTYFGAMNSTGGLPYNGRMDDFRLYTRALNYDEVQHLYTFESPSVAPTVPPTVAPTKTPTMAPTTLFHDVVLYLPLHGNTDDHNTPDNLTMESLDVIFTADRFGISDHAALFAVNSAYIRTVTVDALSMNTSDFTLSAWIKLDPGWIIHGRIISYGGSNNCNIPGYALFVDDGNYLTAFLVCGRASGVCKMQSISATSALSTDIWYHVAFSVTRGGTSRLYINGVAEGEIFNTNDCDLSNGGRTYIGALELAGTFSQQFFGAMDEVVIHSRALSTSDIVQLMSLGAPTMAPTVPPTPAPTISPTIEPTISPTVSPTLSPTASPTHTIDLNLLLHLPFDGGLEAISPRLVSVTGVSYHIGSDRFSVANQSLELTSTPGYAYMGNVQWLRLPLFNFTVSAWIYMTANGTYRSICSRGSDSACTTAGYALVLTESDRVRGRLTCAALSPCTVSSVTSETVLTINTWYHVAFTVIKGGTSSIFINGVLDSSISNTTDCNILRSSLTYIGASNVDGDDQFTGKIDELRVYNSALDADLIAQLHQFGTPSAAPTVTPTVLPTVVPTAVPTSAPTKATDIGLVLYFPFDGRIIARGGQEFESITESGLALGPDRHGTADCAADFDATTGSGRFISLLEEPLQFGTSDFSVSVWIKLNILPDLGTESMIVHHGVSFEDCDPKGYSLSVDSDGRIVGMITCGMIGGVCMSTTVASDGMLSTGEWTLITLTVKRGIAIRIFIDNSLDTVQTTDVIGVNDGECTLHNEVAPIYIGAAGNNHEHEFYGLMDELRMYNIELSSSVVAALYQEGSPTMQPTIAPTQTPTQAPTSRLALGLLLFLPFDGNANDMSANNHVTTVVGSTLEDDRFGVSENACDFSGGENYWSYVKVKESALLQMESTDVTMAMWIYIHSGPLVSHGTIFTHGTWQSPTYYSIYIDIQRALRVVQNCRVGQTFGEAYVESLVGLEPSTWYHVVGVITRGGIISLYTNGQLVSSENSEGGVPLCDSYDTAESFVGAGDSVGGMQFVGRVDGVRVYNRALSSGEIAELYSDGFPTSLPSMQPSSAPSSQPSSQPSSTPSVSPSGQPSGTPTDTPSDQPSTTPTNQPSCLPSAEPTLQPSSFPTCCPTTQPTVGPSSCPSQQPSATPSSRPSSNPSCQPSSQPSGTPSGGPSSQPSVGPTMQPSCDPTGQPSSQPSPNPSSYPSSQPSGTPTGEPSSQPSVAPCASPSSQPSAQPSSMPSEGPTSQPSVIPSTQPHASPTAGPSGQPSLAPSSRPSTVPSNQPSIQPSAMPSSQPSVQPSTSPSCAPTKQPSSEPSVQPRGTPSSAPSTYPSAQPSKQPHAAPSADPSAQPSDLPSTVPSAQPSNLPSSLPSTQPSDSPTCNPSAQPSCDPSSQPSDSPSTQPASSPTSQPQGTPSSRPSAQPSSAPSLQPSAQPSSYPTVHTENPTPRPTTMTIGTLPSNDSISVLRVGNSTASVDMVLPFLFHNPHSGDGYFDVKISGAMNGTGNVLFGKPKLSGDTSVTNLAQNGVVIHPTVSYDFSGRCVANVGDINGDGHDDLIIGVPYAARVYVLFGSVEGFQNLSSGFTVFGAKSSDLTGWSVSAAGDVNNDAVADIIIGAPLSGTSQAGVVYVLYGKASAFRNIELSALSVEDGCTVTGGAAQDNLGLSVSDADDVNGDGYDDIIIGALRQNTLYRGSVYILFGSSDHISSPVSVSALPADRGVVITGPSWSWFGYSVSGAGDMNGDHISDVIIGSVPQKGTASVPLSCILFGNHTLPALRTLESIPVHQKVTFTGGGGVAVRGVGDLNSDTFDDVLILGSDVLLTTGGGIVAYQPAKIRVTNTPTQTPSRVPSLIPTTVATATPTAFPTQPTVAPTEAPSGPTMRPTMMPTQPTSVPSALPTAPTFIPSQTPSVKPSVVASVVPSGKPSTIPSLKPTLAPSVGRTADPTVVSPTVKPTTIQPSRYPVFRPTTAPTRFVAPNITYATVYVNDSGTHVHIRSAVVRTHYIINTTAPAEVVFAGHGNGDMFTLIPNANTQATIKSFNISCDILDLRAFTDIYSAEQLTVTAQSRRRRLLADRTAESVTLLFKGNQRLHLSNVTQAELRTKSQIVFAVPTESPLAADTKKDSKDFSDWSPVVIGGGLAALLVLYLLFKGIVILVEREKLRRVKADPIRWEEMAKSNRTFIRFVHGDTPVGSELSSSSSSGSGSGTGSDDVESVVVSSLRSSEVDSSEGESKSSLESSVGGDRLRNGRYIGIDAAVSDGDGCGWNDNTPYEQNATGNWYHEANRDANSEHFSSNDSYDVWCRGQLPQQPSESMHGNRHEVNAHESNNNNSETGSPQNAGDNDYDDNQVFEPYEQHTAVYGQQVNAPQDEGEQQDGEYRGDQYDVQRESVVYPDDESEEYCDDHSREGEEYGHESQEYCDGQQEYDGDRPIAAAAAGEEEDVNNHLTYHQHQFYNQHEIEKTAEGEGEEDEEVADCGSDTFSDFTLSADADSDGNGADHRENGQFSSSRSSSDASDNY